MIEDKRTVVLYENDLISTVRGETDLSCNACQRGYWLQEVILC
jgi:hypothetical protein